MSLKDKEVINMEEKKATKRVAIENTQAGQRYILVNHDKFGLSSAVTFSDYDGTVTITDREPDDSYNVKMDIRVID